MKKCLRQIYQIRLFGRVANHIILRDHIPGVLCKQTEWEQANDDDANFKHIVILKYKYINPAKSLR